MKEQLITLETAKLAKEKRFNEPCILSYFNTELYPDRLYIDVRDKEYSNGLVQEREGDWTPGTKPSIPLSYFYKNYDNHFYSEYIYLAPTQNLLQTWLRKKHNIIVSITPVKEKHSNDGGRDNISISKDTITNVFEIYIYQDNLLKVNIYNEYRNSSKDCYESALEDGLQKALTYII